MVPKAYAAFWLFKNRDCLLRGHDQPGDFIEELIVIEIKLCGTQDTMEVLAAGEHDAVCARVTINTLKSTSSYFKLLYSLHPRTLITCELKYS